VADTYEPYEPPAEPAREPQDATSAPEPSGQQWPLLDADEPDRPTQPPPVYVRNRPYQVRPARPANPLVAVVGGIAVLAIALGSYSASQASGSNEPDYRDQWQQCLAEEQDNGGLLEPEDLCSIQFPDAEDEYGDLGYDNDDSFLDDEYGSFLDDSYEDPDWYVED
jgi:hypothetical protein